jgi:hypothetical protein
MAAGAPHNGYNMSRRVLDVSLEKQVGDFTCHAAVSQAVIKYYDPSRKNTQHNVCKHYPNDPTGMQDPIEVLEKESIYADQQQGVPSIAIIRREIDAGHPLILKVGQHYILLIGYRLIGSKRAVLYFKDPVTGDKEIQLPSGQDGLSRGFQTKYPTENNPEGEEAVYPVVGFYTTKRPSELAVSIRQPSRRNRSRSRSRSRNRNRNRKGNDRQRAHTRRNNNKNLPPHLQKVANTFAKWYPNGEY